MLIKNKENEIKFLNDEVLNANQKLEFTRQDRMHDQKLLYDLQTQNAFLNMKLNEILEGSSKSNTPLNNLSKQTKGVNVFNF